MTNLTGVQTGNARASGAESARELGAARDTEVSGVHRGAGRPEPGVPHDAGDGVHRRGAAGGRTCCLACTLLRCACCALLFWFAVRAWAGLGCASCFAVLCCAVMSAAVLRCAWLRRDTEYRPVSSLQGGADQDATRQKLRDFLSKSTVRVRPIAAASSTGTSLLTSAAMVHNARRETNRAGLQVFDAAGED